MTEATQAPWLCAAHTTTFFLLFSILVFSSSFFFASSGAFSWCNLSRRVDIRSLMLAACAELGVTSER